MTGDRRRLLVVDDEAHLRRTVEVALTSKGYDVDVVATGDAAVAAVAATLPDLLIVDLGLPGMSGIEVIDSVRAWNPLPIIVLSARDRESDKVAALDAGADDYVTKPFGVRELVARARGLLRRGRRVDAPRSIQIGRGTLDLTTACFREAGTTAVLTAREAQLLAHLALPPGRVVGREELLVQVWGYKDGTVRTRTVDVHIQQLREKLPRGSQRIATIRGRGYRLELEH